MLVKKQWIGYRFDIMQPVECMAKMDIPLLHWNRDSIIRTVFKCIDEGKEFTASLSKKNRDYTLCIMSSSKIHFKQVVAAIQEASLNRNMQSNHNGNGLSSKKQATRDKRITKR